VPFGQTVWRKSLKRANIVCSGGVRGDRLGRIFPEEVASTVNAVERRVLAVSSFGHLVSHYNMVAFPAVVLPVAAMLNMEMAAVVGLSFWMYFLFGATALPWGILGDRWGGKPLLLLQFAGTGLCGFAAAYYMDNPSAFAAALAGIGIFSGIYHPIGVGLVSKHIERISVAMGYNAVFGGLGLVLGPLGTGIVNWISGPQAAYVFLALFNFAGLLLMAVLPLPAPPVREKRAAASGGAGALTAFIVLISANMLAGIAYSGATVILTPYLELRSGGIFQALSSALGVHISGNLLAAVLSSAVYILGMAGQYIGGFVGERHDTRYTYLAFHLACIPAAFLMGIASNQPLVGLAMFYMFFMLGMQPAENTLVAQLSPPGLHHSAFGLKFIATFGMGSLGVKLVQWVESSWGVGAVLPVLGAVSVILVLSILVLIWQTNRRPAS